MIKFGFSARELDEMMLDEIASWRRLMAAYIEAVERGVAEAVAVRSFR